MFYTSKKTESGDLFRAINVIEGKPSVLDDKESYTAVQTFSNCDINSDLQNISMYTNDILILGPSTDHVFECVFKGIKNIDIIDVNRFTKYIIALKIALLKTCTRENYISFLTNNSSSKILFNNSLSIMNSKDRYFFEQLNKCFTLEEIKKNFLLQDNIFNIDNLEYLKEDNYYETVSKLSKTNISNHDYNEFFEQKALLNKYDQVIITNPSEEVFNSNYYPGLNSFLDTVTVNKSKVIYSKKAKANSNFLDIKSANELINEVPNDKRITKNNKLNLFDNINLDNFDLENNNIKTALCQTAAGDNIFDLILKGVEKVDTYDKNDLSKYFFELKKAMIKTLSYDEYIDFFITNKLNKYMLFEKIKEELFDENLKFFNHIYTTNKNIKNVNDKLFDFKEEVNPFLKFNYLEKEAYNILKKMIDNVVINFHNYEKNIIKKLEIDNKYDVILNVEKEDIKNNIVSSMNNYNMINFSEIKRNKQLQKR